MRLCEASTQQSDDKYSQPSASHELIGRGAKNTGGLVTVAVCVRVCVCIVVDREKMVPVCVWFFLSWVCAFLSFFLPATPPGHATWLQFVH